MRIKKNIPRWEIYIFLAMLILCLIVIYRLVITKEANFFDIINWIMFMCVFQNIIAIIEPKDGFKDEEEEKQFADKCDSNTLAVSCICLIVIGAIFYYCNISLSLDENMAGIYLLMLSTGIIFIRMIIYLIGCINYTKRRML